MPDIRRDVSGLLPKTAWQHHHEGMGEVALKQESTLVEAREKHPAAVIPVGVGGVSKGLDPHRHPRREFGRECQEPLGEAGGVAGKLIRNQTMERPAGEVEAFVEPEAQTLGLHLIHEQEDNRETVLPFEMAQQANGNFVKAAVRGWLRHGRPPRTSAGDGRRTSHCRCGN